MGSEKGVCRVIWDLGARGSLRGSRLPVVTDRDKMHDEIGLSHFQADGGGSLGIGVGVGMEGLAVNFHWTADREAGGKVVTSDCGWRLAGSFVTPRVAHSLGRL